MPTKIVSNPFEQLFELGKSTARESVNAVGKVVSPLELLNSAMGSSGAKQIEAEAGKAMTEMKSKGATPLNLKTLSEKYREQDEQKTKQLAEQLRKQYHRTSQQEELRIMQEREARLQQARQQTEREKTNKDEQLKKQQSYFKPIPEGKKRRSIFSHKKLAQREQVEMKPASGKQ